MSEWSLERLLANLHDDIQRRLEVARQSFGHPGTKGDASENVWLDLLNTYLPKRYQAAKAHVVDSNGTFSDQIDVVVYDRQYSPFIFRYEEQTIIPAESVYAVFEAKQTLNRGAYRACTREGGQRASASPDQPADSPCRRDLSSQAADSHMWWSADPGERLEARARRTTICSARRWNEG